ncbi:MAG: CBS domain-containing protein [SAR324 cluster bacterium]|nr:CBS domain-containing protein [SAR324 cluster bacterium]
MNTPVHTKAFSPFSNIVYELVKGPIHTIGKGTSIQEAANKMTKKSIGSLVVVEKGQPIGIVTKTDLVRRVLAVSKETNLPIEEIMSPQILSIEYDRPIFEGLLLMLRHKITHLLVIGEGIMVGMISEHDWVRYQARHPAYLFRAIEEASTIADAAELKTESNVLIENIFEEEGDARSLTMIVTEVNDRITEAIIANSLREMKEDGKGEPPVEFCWMAMGSEGRKEQTSSTDQDNGIVFANVPDSQFVEVQQWFLQFAEKAVEGLETCGFPRCEGNIMASNPELCLSVDRWHQIFHSIVVNPEPDSLLKASTYFDFRALYGQTRFVDELWEGLLQAIENNKSFLRFLTENMIKAGRPPVKNWKWRLRRLIEMFPPPVDIKREALAPLVRAIRVLALTCGSPVTHSMERLDVIEKAGLLSPEVVGAVREAYDFILLLRIRQDFARKEGSTRTDNMISFRELNPLQGRFLRDSLRTVYELQDLIYGKFEGNIF